MLEYYTLMNDALIDLQTRLVFQEDTIEQLNAVVTDQQRALDGLRDEVGQLRQLVIDLKRSLPEGPQDNAPPPHY